MKDSNNNGALATYIHPFLLLFYLHGGYEIKLATVIFSTKIYQKTRSPESESVKFSTTEK